jgi:hypothetical protein
VRGGINMTLHVALAADVSLRCCLQLLRVAADGDTSASTCQTLLAITLAPTPGCFRLSVVQVVALLVGCQLTTCVRRCAQ